MKPDICIHHAPCADGFTAAWAVWKRWPDIEFVPGVYGQEPPDVAGKHVLIVDFSYKRPVLEAMASRAASVTVIDHHKSAEADLAAFTSIDGILISGDELERQSALMGTLPIQARFRMDRSGAMLAWEYAHPGEEVPDLVKHVQDRDLWLFELDGTREISAELFSWPYEFDVWDGAATMLRTPDLKEVMIQRGQAIERKHHKDIAELLKLTTRTMVIGGVCVPVANLPYTMSSDAANTLSEGHPFGACYYDNAAGKRVFSLRSKADGADVSDVAVKYGGGGHAHAAGFSAPLGWEGE